MAELRHNRLRAAFLRLHVACKKFRPEINSHDAALIRQCPNHFVRHAPGMGIYAPAVGVGRHKGLFTKSRHIPETAIGQMGHVHNHAQLVHADNSLPAKVRQPLFHH